MMALFLSTPIDVYDKNKYILIITKEATTSIEELIMHRNKGNTAGPKLRLKKVTPEQSAQFIAESIEAKVAAGVQWSFSDYGIADKPEMIDLVCHYNPNLRG